MRPPLRVLALIADRSSPPVSGAKVRNYCLWPAVRSAGAEVRVAGIGRGPPAAETPDQYLPLKRDPHILRAWHSLSHSYHEWPVAPALHAHVREVLATWQPDVVHAEELRMAAYLPRRASGAHRPILSVTVHNVESDLLRATGSTHLRIGRSLIERRHLRSLQRYEREHLGRVDVAFAYSSVDFERWMALRPTVPWDMTRNGTDARGVQPAPEAGTPGVLLIGTLSYAPNVRGIRWFVEQVAPRLDASVRITVAGSGATPEVRALLERSRAAFVDTPTDLGPLYAEHTLAVVPLHEGSGTRGKILEALAHGRVVVSTTVGAAGLELSDDEGVVRRDSPEAFATEVSQLLADADARRTLAARGRAAVLQRYDWSVVAEGLLEAWRRCASR